MKAVRFTLTLIAISIIASSAVHGQATRTWVSGVGDDANPCSRTAPCKTFAGAISKTSTGGEIDNLDTGGFGALTITKSITIDGGGGQVASILVSGTNGITIAAGATSVVTLRNISFQGIGSGLNGLELDSAQALHIERCEIANFTGNGIQISPNTNSSTNTQVFIENSVSQDNTGYGLYVIGNSSGNVHVAVSRSRFTGNGLAGVDSADYSRTTLNESEASGNANQGFLALANNGSATLNLANSVSTNNVTGVQAGGGTAASTIRMNGDSAFNNTVGLSIASNGTIDSFGNNYNAGGGAPNGSIAPQ